MTTSTLTPALIAGQIGAHLAVDRGLPGTGICVWRKDGSHQFSFEGSVAELLADPEYQSGTWLIDVGQGAPPGPVHVRWNEMDHRWENGGFQGHVFVKEAEQRIERVRDNLCSAIRDRACYDRGRQEIYWVNGVDTIVDAFMPSLEEAIRELVDAEL